jgi:hypothetical protein
MFRPPKCVDIRYLKLPKEPTGTTGCAPASNPLLLAGGVV